LNLNIRTSIAECFISQIHDSLKCNKGKLWNIAGNTYKIINEYPW
jgi:hypothetical protein